MRRFQFPVWVAVLAAAVMLDCSKAKVPENLRGIPADADLVATVDARAVLAYAKQAAQRLIPVELKDKVPTFEAVAQQALHVVGIDLSKLGKVTYIGYFNSKDQMAFVAEGIEITGLKGQKTGEHNGVALYELPESIHYAPIANVGVVVGPSPEMVKKILDSYAGKVKTIGDSDRGELLKQLVGMESGLDQLRLYVLSGSIPGAPPPFPMKGGGFFLHLDRGIAGAVFSEEKNAKDLKSNFELGKLALQMAVATGGSLPGAEGLGLKLDEPTKKMISELINGIKVDQSGGTFAVSFHGDIKPLIEKAVAIGFDAFKAEKTAFDQDIEKAADPVDPAAEKAAPKTP